MSRPFRKFIDIDVMLRGRFVHTFRISTLLADGKTLDGMPIFTTRRLKEYIESRLPSLKAQPYNINICF